MQYKVFMNYWKLLGLSLCNLPENFSLQRGKFAFCPPIRRINAAFR